MTSKRETDQPNEFGFSGEGTGPQPEPDHRTASEVDGESIAIPSGDLTGAITHALEEVVEHHHDQDEDD